MSLSLNTGAHTGETNKSLSRIKKLSRKRSRDTTTWKRNIQKKLRLDGKDYYTQHGKLKPAKHVQATKCRCHYKCPQFFPQEDRNKILASFLKLKTQELKWNFICKHITCIAKKRCYSENTDRRAKTYVYMLTLNQTPRQVCKKFFLETLNISSKMVRTAITKHSDSGTINPDMRGKKAHPKKVRSS